MKQNAWQNDEMKVTSNEKKNAYKTMMAAKAKAERQILYNICK